MPGFLSAQAQELRLAIRAEGAQALSLFSLETDLPEGDLFIEFSIKGIWLPAFFRSSNATQTSSLSLTNTGGLRLFRGSHGGGMARLVKDSWERLGVTNYVFHYVQSCLCAITSATVTVKANEVVKVEDVRDFQDKPATLPPSWKPPTISQMFDSWIFAEPRGGYARALEFNSSGIPTLISIDPIPQAADDEQVFTIDRFTALP